MCIVILLQYLLTVKLKGTLIIHPAPHEAPLQRCFCTISLEPDSLHPAPKVLSARSSRTLDYPPSSFTWLVSAHLLPGYSTMLGYMQMGSIHSDKSFMFIGPMIDSCQLLQHAHADLPISSSPFKQSYDC